MGLVTGSPNMSRKVDWRKGVELGEGLAALGPQGVRRIQNRRNPLLLGERREREPHPLQILKDNAPDCGASCSMRSLVEATIRL